MAAPDDVSKRPQSKKAVRAARLAKELRANLKRRKTAADGRPSPETPLNARIKHQD